MTTFLRTSPWPGILVLVLLFPALDARAQDVFWRTDYNKARREAQEKNLPLVIDFITENCFRCKQLDIQPFPAPEVRRLLNTRCVPLKVHAGYFPTLAQALHIQNFPTLVFATADGRILHYQEGFLEPEALKDRLHR